MNRFKPNLRLTIIFMMLMAMLFVFVTNISMAEESSTQDLYSKQVQLRVEGISQNIYNGTVTVNKEGEVPTALDALAQA